MKYLKFISQISSQTSEAGAAVYKWRNGHKKLCVFVQQQFCHVFLKIHRRMCVNSHTLYVHIQPAKFNLHTSNEHIFNLKRKEEK